jgi:hypothetical protein
LEFGLLRGGYLKSAEEEPRNGREGSMDEGRSQKKSKSAP